MTWRFFPPKLPVMREKRLSIVISAYNEEGNIKELYNQVKAAVSGLPIGSAELIFVDDGSTDRTLLYCYELQLKDPDVKIVRLIRNFGHEIAMTAGMDHAAGDAVIFMDADLQHPPSFIPAMVDMWLRGNDVVLTKRTDNMAASRFYKLCSKMFYKALNMLSDTRIPEGAPDFRLVDRKYIDFLKCFDERDSLFRGILNWMGPSDNVPAIEFVAPKRLSGSSKYNFLKSLKLAVNSILQFSVKPLYLSLWLAVASILIAAGIGFYAFFEYFFLKNPTPGYATTVVTVAFMEAINLFILAILGAYIAKIHMETKKRPLYLAEFITSDSPAVRREEDAAQNH